MSKRLLQILDEMNVADTENKTRNVSIANTLVSVKKVKAGGLVEIGVDGVAADQLLQGMFGKSTHAAFLVVVNLEEYKRMGGN